MATHDAQGRELFVCSECKCRRIEAEFEFDRHGNRRKCCIPCKARRMRTRCPHGRQPIKCRGCGGASICPHNRRRETCRDCGGSEICPHSRRRQICRECDGASICEHGRRRIQCWSCDPVGALQSRANSRIVQAIGSEARAGRSTAELLGCDKATFFHHIEAQFKDGMSWARIDEIEIDHRVPIEYPGVAGGPPTLEEKVARLNYLNCQPMWAPDNWAKGNRWADPLPEAPASPAEAEKPPALTLTDADIEELLCFTL